jgi:hypothetical protein
MPTYDRYTHSSGPFKGQAQLKGLTVKQVYAKPPPPSTVGKGIVVEVELNIDDGAFYPIKPTVQINVPVENNGNEVEVFAPAVSKGRVRSAAAKAVLG